jgi:hypothetical protein
MGKNKNRNKKRKLKHDGGDLASNNTNSSPTTPSSSSSNHHNKNKAIALKSNPLLEAQQKFLNCIPKHQRDHFFDNSKVDPETRAELWMRQADVGEELINRYAWATPDDRAMNILKHFSPLVEIGCGANAYWLQMALQAGIDMIGYDTQLEDGGLISHSNADGSQKSKKGKKHLPVKQGGPEVLSTPAVKDSNRTLFLCYPDEDVEGEDEVRYEDEEEDEDEDDKIESMAFQCLEHYSGTYVIHVGELFSDANLSLDQAPFGRSSSPEFQQRLASEYHCVLKVELPSWLHVRDTLSVWKRSEICTMVFAADSDDDEEEDDEEVEYRHIPPKERLPMSIAAPYLQHLLNQNRP